MTCYLIKNAKLLLHLTTTTSLSHYIRGTGCSGILEHLQLVMVALLLGLSILSRVNMVAVSKLGTLVSLLLNGNDTHSNVPVSPPDLCKTVCAKSIADRLTHRKAQRIGSLEKKMQPHPTVQQKQFSQLLDSFKDKIEVKHDQRNISLDNTVPYAVIQTPKDVHLLRDWDHFNVPYLGKIAFSKSLSILNSYSLLLIF